jgi:hypothetical protein
VKKTKPDENFGAPDGLAFVRFVLSIGADVEIAQKALAGSDSQFARRTLVRTVFAAVEGICWEIKWFVYRQVEGELLPYERVAVLGESYAVFKSGKISKKSNYMPTITLIRLLINLVKKFDQVYEADLGGEGWSGFQHAVEVRNRITHPKRAIDLDVSDEDVIKTSAGYKWFMAFATQVLRSTVQFQENRARKILHAFKDADETPALRRLREILEKTEDSYQADLEKLRGMD